MTASKSRQAAVCPRRRGKSHATAALEARVIDFLVAFDGSVSTRQMFYQLVSAGAVPNTNAGYDRAQRLLVQMRRAGLVPYDRIVDRTRAKHQAAGWDGVEEVLGAVAKQYRRNRWTDQRTIVMVACEKQALEGIFGEVCDAYGASLWVVHGFASLSFLYEWATEIRDLTDAGHEVVVSYFGDFDPSGLCLEEKCKDALREHGAVFEWERAGLLARDFRRFRLIKIPVKRTDSRSRAYLEKYGDRAAELDALPPTELQRRIHHAIESRLDVEAWNRLSAVEAAERKSIDTVVGRWNVALAAAAVA